MTEFVLESPRPLDVIMDYWRRRLYPLKLAYTRSEFIRGGCYDGYVNTKGVVYLLCLWHRERTPSLCIHQNSMDRPVYCYGCGKQASVEELTEKIR